MIVRATLELDMQDEQTARNIYESLHADDDGYITHTIEGSVIHVIAESDSIGTVREALEDYLSCMGAAMGSVTCLNRSPDGP